MKNLWLIAALLFAPYAVAQISSGTAFAVAPGLLVTNQHVVEGCASVEVVASDGRRTGAVVDADALIDLALIRVTGLKGATARLRSPRSVRLGEAVMVFGFPLSGSLTSGGNFTSGLVSGLRGLRDAAGEIQITAPVQPGNSGGEYRDGKMHGQGTHTWPSGQKYVGEFMEGQPNGQGTHTWPDGQKYVGEYSDGKRSGQGTQTRPDGSVIHSGLWADDKPVR